MFLVFFVAWISVLRVSRGNRNINFYVRDVGFFRREYAQSRKRFWKWTQKGTPANDSKNVAFHRCTYFVRKKYIGDIDIDTRRGPRTGMGNLQDGKIDIYVTDVCFSGEI